MPQNYTLHAGPGVIVIMYCVLWVLWLTFNQRSHSSQAWPVLVSCWFFAQAAVCWRFSASQGYCNQRISCPDKWSSCSADHLRLGIVISKIHSWVLVDHASVGKPLITFIFVFWVMLYSHLGMLCFASLYFIILFSFFCFFFALSFCLRCLFARFSP